MDISYDFISRAESRELILFIHGLAASRRSFDSAIKSGIFDDFNILNVDLIGFGESDKPEDFDYEMASQAKILDNLMGDFNEFDRFHIAAHSMGNAVALLLSRDLIGGATTFANLEGNLIPEDCEMFSRRVIKFAPDKYASLLFPKHKKAFAEHPLFDFDNTTPEAVYKSSESLVKWSDNGELLNRFMELNCRKAYFYGEENRGIPVLDKLEGIPQVEIHSAGHCMMTDNPDEFARALTRFIGDGFS